MPPFSVSVAAPTEPAIVLAARTDVAVLAGEQRFPMVDVVRFVCILWVIWIHIVEAPELSGTLAFVRFRMPVFVILSIFFLLVSLERHPHRTLVEYACDRLKKLYVPFLGWTAIYYLIHGCYDTFLRHSDWPAVSRGILIHGQAVHLWFVPFIVAVDIFCFPIARRLLRLSSHKLLIASISLIAGILLAVAAGPFFTDSLIDFDYPAHLKDLLWRAITLSPCIPLGLAAFFIFRWVKNDNSASASWLGWVGLALAAASAGICLIMGAHPLPESAAGLGIVLFALEPPGNLTAPRLARWGRYSFGMYLVHLLFVDAMHVLREFAFHLPACWWYDVLSFLLCAVATIGTTLVLARWRLTRWLVFSRGAERKPQSDVPNLSVQT